MRITKFMAGLVLMTLWAASPGRAQTGTLPAVSAREFAIMAWGFSPSNLAQLQEMKEAGLNVSGFCKVADLDRVAAAGLACFVYDTRAKDYNWQNPPPVEKIRANLASLAADVRNKPAFLGVFLRDEPSVALMPGLGEAADAVRQAMPGALPYIDLFPVNGGPGMGVADYHTYVQQALDQAHPSFLSYDNYSLVNGQMLDRFYTNLHIIRVASLQAHIPFWNCILATAHRDYMEATDATFNLQVYGTLAYGGRGIEYYTYFTPAAGTHRLGPIDRFGNRTPTWDMMRRINLQIQALAPTLIHLHSTGVYHGPDVPPESNPMAASRLVSQVVMSAADGRPAASARYLVGEFQDDQGRPYVMVVNKDLNHSYSCELQLRQSGRKLFLVSSTTGQEEPATGVQKTLAPGAGILLRIQ